MGMKYLAYLKQLRYVSYFFQSQAIIRRIFQQAFPMFLGQLAVVGYGVLDSAMCGHRDAQSLAVLALAGGVYLTCSIGLGGILLSLNPLVAHDFGAQKTHRVRVWLFQSIWPVLLCTVLSLLVFQVVKLCLPLLGFEPALLLANERYLNIISFGLPAAFGLRALYAISNAISENARVMRTQMIGLCLKIPLNYVFIFYLPEYFPGVANGLDASSGCAIATVITFWVLFILMWRDFYRHPMHRQILKKSRSVRQVAAFAQLPLAFAFNKHYQFKLIRLGLPSALIITTEVAAFTLMAWLIAPFGDIQTAAHQIAACFAGVVYMVPLSMAIATSTQVAQQLGAQQPEQARKIAIGGLLSGTLITMILGFVVLILAPNIARFYTDDVAVMALAAVLLRWVCVYQCVDAVQAIACNVLRAYKITLLPMLIYLVSLLGIGFSMGYASAHQVGVFAALPFDKAHGYWFGTSVGLTITAVFLCFVLFKIFRISRDRLRLK